MPNYGSYSKLDMESVKSDAGKTIAYLNKVIPSIVEKQRKPYVVVFLGETHRNPVDNNVTSEILLAPPVVVPNTTRLIFERTLDQTYPLHTPAFNSVRVEPVDHGLSPIERSKKMADMIQDAFDNHGMTMVYIPCGSAHAEDIYNSMNKRFGHRFLFIVKMSSTD